MHRFAAALADLGVKKGDRVVLMSPNCPQYVIGYMAIQKIGGQTATEEELIHYCRSKLAAYKVPRQVEFRDSLPKTIVGKVLRRYLTFCMGDGEPHSIDRALCIRCGECLARCRLGAIVPAQG